MMNDPAKRFSSQFIEFLAKWEDYKSFGSDNDWSDQVTERLKSNRESREAAKFRLDRLATSERAQTILQRVIDIFEGLIQGNRSILSDTIKNSTFLGVVGAPRSGGSYLTAELYSALGFDANRIPALLGHDGHPNAKPFTLRANANSDLNTVFSFAEYLTALEIFTVDRPTAYIPKKLTKAVYAGGLFKDILGSNAEYIVTIRHPIASCISMYEKSGGLDPERKTRSTIERWVTRDIFLGQAGRPILAGLDYIERYIRYWEHYHIRLASSGLLARRQFTVLGYDPEIYTQASVNFRARFKNIEPPGHFYSSGSKSAELPGWQSRASTAIARVNGTWEAFGIPFPMETVNKCL